MGELVRVDFQTGRRLADGAMERYNEAKRALTLGATNDSRINAAAIAIANTDETYRVLAEGVHLEVDLGELHAIESKALDSLTEREKIEAINLARQDNGA